MVCVHEQHDLTHNHSLRLLTPTSIPSRHQVMQTLLEAEQVCAELQHSVSGLDSRLAELLHWEAEARELYQILRAAERQQRGQDPQARVRSPTERRGSVHPCLINTECSLRC